MEWLTNILKEEEQLHMIELDKNTDSQINKLLTEIKDKPLPKASLSIDTVMKEIAQTKKHLQSTYLESSDLYFSPQTHQSLTLIVIAIMCVSFSIRG